MPPERPPLDDVERDLFNYIRAAPVFPTFAQITAELGWSSTQAATYRMKRLVAKGYVVKLRRGLYRLPPDLAAPAPPSGRRVVGGRGAVVPYRGKVSCGAGIENDEAVDELPLDVGALLARDGVAVFEASGTSMIDAHIQPGDLLFVREDPDPPTGHTVIAMLDREMLCKRLAVRTADRVVLKPANGEAKGYDFDPARVYFRILGVLKNVLRKV